MSSDGEHKNAIITDSSLIENTTKEELQPAHL